MNERARHGITLVQPQGIAKKEESFLHTLFNHLILLDVKIPQLSRHALKCSLKLVPLCEDFIWQIPPCVCNIGASFFVAFFIFINGFIRMQIFSCLHPKANLFEVMLCSLCVAIIFQTQEFPRPARNVSNSRWVAQQISVTFNSTRSVWVCEG